MQRKIQELADQATGYCDTLDIADQKIYYKIWQREFAELIVRECCEVAHCNFHVDGLTLGTILKEHFGVEE